MSSENIIQIKSYQFALNIIRFYKEFILPKKEYVLGKQILRSGTSIGANIEEALGGQSRKDFISKMSIAYKEARETYYWIKLIKDSTSVEANAITVILSECGEITRILSSIIKTTKIILNS